MGVFLLQSNTPLHTHSLATARDTIIQACQIDANYLNEISIEEFLRTEAGLITCLVSVGTEFFARFPAIMFTNIMVVAHPSHS